MFTRQHYVKVAAILKDIREAETKRQLVREFSSLFMNDNERFNRHRFYEACNYTEDD